ncbi:MAG: hypothetical protein A4S09_04560 [Proteobacteria bacterium SG_bin7]|nr:MAG: hypothetical protein A4S09_04560 [Proteobacteria bacterium SG_bin7]
MISIIEILLQDLSSKITLFHMAFYLEFVDTAALIHFQGPHKIVETLVESIQESLARRVSKIYIELPEDDAQVAGIREVINKLCNLLLKKGQSLYIMNSTGMPETKWQKDLASVGAVFVKREDIARKKIRNQRASAKEKAEAMLHELKSKDKREFLFGLDFKKIYKDADFQIFPDYQEQFLAVRMHLETEIRLKERLNREKKLYASRILQLRSVAAVNAVDELQFRELQSREDQYKNLRTEIYDLYRKSGVRASSELSVGQETRRRELEAIKEKLLKELEDLREK